MDMRVDASNPEEKQVEGHRSSLSLGKVAAVVVGALALVWLAFTVNGMRNRADVIRAVRSSPETVSLSVDSCNQNPEVAELEETEPGVFEVLVRTQLPSTGNDCADGVSIDVDPELQSIVIVDRASGESFSLGTGEPAPIGLNGIWRMTTVDIGFPVTVGETTAEIPEIMIRAGEEAGVISGVFGCNRLSIEVTFTPDTIRGRPETLEGTEELCSVPDGSEELVLTERILLELLSGDEPAEVFLEGNHLEIGTQETNAVFERVLQ